MTLDIDFIANYIQHYDIGIPKSLVSCCIVGMCGIVAVLLTANRQALAARASMFFACVYVFFVLYITVISRHRLGHSSLNINPLWDYMVLNNRIISEIILNILLFLPIGFFVGCIFPSLNVWKICALGAGFSLTIELTQLLTERGICNISDVVHNTLGCMMGYGFYRLCLAYN